MRARHEDTCGLGHPATPAATVVAVRAAGDGYEYLVLSDSSLAADHGDGRPPTVITDSARATASPDAARRARTGILPATGLRGIALLSDGAARITDRYGLRSWPQVLTVLREAGPGELVRQVRAAEDTDPGGPAGAAPRSATTRRPSTGSWPDHPVRDPSGGSRPRC